MLGLVVVGICLLLLTHWFLSLPPTPAFLQAGLAFGLGSNQEGLGSDIKEEAGGKAPVDR